MIITGKRIKEMREAAGLSQTDLSGMANISQAHIAKIETEKVNPRLSTVNTLISILQNKKRITTCGDVMSRKLVKLKPEDTAKKAVKLMKSFGISQLPVIERGRVTGSVSESTIIKNMDKNPEHVKVSEIMEEPFPMVSESDPAEMLSDMLEFHHAVLVSKKGRLTGIITKFNLLVSK